MPQPAKPPMPKKPKVPPVPGQEVDTDSSDDPTSMFGDDSGDDATPGSTQDQMSADTVTIKQKKNKHAYQVKWS